jgi:hypothetical protein
MPRPRPIFAVLFPAAILLGVTVLLFQLKVPLGQGSLVYRWSELEAYKLTRTPAGLFAVALMAVAVLCLYSRRANARRLGGVMMVAGWLGLVAWTMFAPPSPRMQHLINGVSPSQDGAFVLESAAAASPGGYMKMYPARMGSDVTDMLGTRVLSNPPGTTLLAIVARSFGQFPDPELRTLDSGAAGSVAHHFDAALWFAALTALLWAAAPVALYFAARTCLPPGAAALVGVAGVTSAAALAFAPGKDTAQVLLVCLQLLAAARLARSGHFVAGVLLGAVSTLAVGFGLLLLWTGLAVVAWAIWERARRSSLRSAALLCAPVLLGGGAMVVVLFVTLGWNLPATTLLVARKFGEVQSTIAIDRATWWFIGLPIWVVLGPVAAASVLLLRRGISRRGGTGVRLLVTTTACMAMTYVFGVQYELPRLWLAFTPLIVMAAVASVPALGSRSPAIGRLAAMLLAAHLATAVLQWTVLDLRESEYRIRTQRMFH